MRITKIEQQKKRPARKSIFADGQYVAGISNETLLRLALRVGDELSPDILKTLQRTEELLQAKGAALRFLATRPRTEREIRDKLREKEFSDDDISRTIGELRNSGLLNDLEFARMYIRDALALKRLGRIVLARKLLLLGVNKETTDQAITEAFADVDSQLLALEAGRQFLKKAAMTRRNNDPAKVRARLAAFLLRRGYPWDVSGPVVKTLMGNKLPDEDHE